MERQAALELVDPAESTNGQKAKELHVGFSEAPPSVAVVDSTEVDAKEPFSWQAWCLTIVALIFISAPFWAVPLFCEKQFGQKTSDDHSSSYADEHSDHRRLGGGGEIRFCDKKLPFYLGVAYTLFAA